MSASCARTDSGVKVNFDINAVGVYDAGTQEVISW